MRRYVASVVLVLAVVTCGCEWLGSLQNPEIRIAGEWQRIEMSFPGADVYDFDDRVIRINGLERGTYRFATPEEIEVTLDDVPKKYEIEFVGDSTMIWYRTTPKGRDRVFEWRRVPADTN